MQYWKLAASWCQALYARGIMGGAAHPSCVAISCIEMKSKLTSSPSLSRKMHPTRQLHRAFSQSSCLKIFTRRPVNSCDPGNRLRTDTRTSPPPCSTWTATHFTGSTSYQPARSQELNKHSLAESTPIAYSYPPACLVDGAVAAVAVVAV